MAKVYSAADASQLTAELQKLASTSKRFTLRELVAEYQVEIEQALSLGHSRDAILAVFHSMGMQASWWSVSKYLRELKAAQPADTTPAVEGADAVSVVEQSDIPGDVSGLPLPVSTVNGDGNGNGLTVSGSGGGFLHNERD